jgi:hypothetical protein
MGGRDDKRDTLSLSRRAPRDINRGRNLASALIAPLVWVYFDAGAITFVMMVYSLTVFPFVTFGHLFFGLWRGWG